MKFAHIAGEEMFIDFSGEKLRITDRDTGEVVPLRLAGMAKRTLMAMVTQAEVELIYTTNPDK